MPNSACKIKVGVELDTSEIDAKLQEKSGKIKLDADVSGGEELDKLHGKLKDVGLEYQQYKIILDKCIDTIKSMAEQTIKLDTAQTELRKVSDLSGKSLDNYTKKLADMGKQVGRSG